MGKDRFSKKSVDSVLAFRISCFVVAMAVSAQVCGQGPQRLSRSKLPEPPKQLKKLLAAGGVTFEVGPRASAGDPRIIGETRYEISYRYKSNAKWRLTRGDRGARVVIIDADFSRVQWNPKHVIWLRDQPDADGFWSDSVLLHEFDHLRISTDPRVARKFAELLKQRQVIRHQLQPGEYAGSELTDKLVEREARAVFDEVTDLIAIRYRELDRETSHGRQALPPGSELYGLLRPESASGSQRGASDATSEE